MLQNNPSGPVLLLMRHAKSSWSDATLADHDRPLNKRGQKAARRMAVYLRTQGLQPSRIYTSSALRAVETARIVIEEFEHPEMKILQHLYHASASQWQHLLAGIANDRTVLIIGHNPGMEELLSAIAGEFVRLPTAAIACLKSPADSLTFQADQLKLGSVWRPKELQHDSEEDE